MGFVLIAGAIVVRFANCPYSSRYCCRRAVAARYGRLSFQHDCKPTAVSTVSAVLTVSAVSESDGLGSTCPVYSQSVLVQRKSVGRAYEAARSEAVAAVVVVDGKRARLEALIGTDLNLNLRPSCFTRNNG